MLQSAQAFGKNLNKKAKLMSTSHPAPVKIGIVGCGNISSIYFQTAQKLDILEVAACADLDLERARTRAAEYGIAKALSLIHI